MKKKALIFALLLSVALAAVATPVPSYAVKHKHIGTVSIKSIKERNGYLIIKWKKSKNCKGYCVHLQCGKKTLYAHCYGKTISTARIKLTNTLRKKLDKCGSWEAIVYCSNTGPHGAGGGRGG